MYRTFKKPNIACKAEVSMNTYNKWAMAGKSNLQFDTQQTQIMHHYSRALPIPLSRSMWIPSHQSINVYAGWIPCHQWNKDEKHPTVLF